MKNRNRRNGQTVFKFTPRQSVLVLGNDGKWFPATVVSQMSVVIVDGQQVPNYAIDRTDIDNPQEAFLFALETKMKHE